MAKTTDEIKDLLATEVFKNGIANKYIVVSDDMTFIYYNCKNKAKRRLQNPEEFVQAAVFLKLIFEYNYLPQNISVNESVQMGAETKEADILVYNEKNNKILIVVECKEEGINERQFQVAVDQAYSYAHSLAATYTWVTSGAYSGYVWFHDYRIFASDCSVVRSKDESKYLTQYLYWVMKLKQSEIYKMQKGAGQPHVYPSDIAKITIPAIDLTEQKRIVAHIQSITEKATLLQKEATEGMGRAKREVERMITEKK